MLDIFRDSPAGQIIRLISRGRLAKYPEEADDFEAPDLSLRLSSDLKKPVTARSSAEADSQNFKLVTWYTENDPANPLNWSLAKKAWISVVLFFYSFAGYIGASLYAAGAPDISHIFGVNNVVTGLGLAIYVFAYGIGPMLFSPLSEVPSIGRNWPYIISFAIFVLLCIPTSVVNNFGGLLVLRFLLGFFCSPCLATVGAIYSDMFGPKEPPYVIAIWGGDTTMAPALGPLIGGVAVEAMNWHWSSWELLWLSTPILVAMFFALPETSSDSILLKRAQRLRAITGQNFLRSESEFRQSRLKTSQIAFDTLVKPWEINALDPAILFSTFYLGLNYGTFYSFFESFPLVYGDIYKFDLTQVGLCHLSVLVGFALAIPSLCLYFRFIAPKRHAKLDVIPPRGLIISGTLRHDVDTCRLVSVR
ncbi:major facilitator superfamily domain-containing protein [Trichoderma camerunense]